MKKMILTVVSCIFLQIIMAQQVIQLYAGTAPGSESWTWNEKEMFSPIFNTQVVYNISQPTLIAYLPDKSVATGVSVIIAPGGAFHILSINSEGIDVAKWLQKKGIAAFVLKYRVAHSLTDDPVKELMPKMSDEKIMGEVTSLVVPLATADGLIAMKHVRSNAAKYNIDPAKIGFMGFSAGGTVTMGVVFNSDKDSKPAFGAPIYPFISADLAEAKIPADAPPLFICAATNDGLKLATHSSNLYNKWIADGKSAELHMYAKGDHGFGMRRQNLPTDKWIERFYEWLEVQGIVKKNITK